jgi:predicted RecB family nuclease
MLPPLTASDFYKFLTCPHWPWFERFASPEEQKLKRKLTSGEERRLDDGFAHERAVMQELTSGQRVMELSTAGDAMALYQATLHAMEEGAEMIYQATLIDGDWHGRPDLLVRQEGASKLGNWHYVPADIKSSHELKPAHRLQLVFYSFLLERIQGVFPAKAAIVNRDRDWHWFEPKGSIGEFEDVLAKLEAIRAGERPEPVLRKACFDTSPWGEACKRQAEAEHDIALLFNVDVKKLAALRDLGIRTVDDAAEMRVEDLAGAAPGLTAHALEVAKLQARSLRDRTIFIKEPIALPQAPLEIYFDIESDLPNDVDYLYGFLLHEQGSSTATYRPFVAEKPEDEKKMWREFLAWLETLPPEYVVYHYAPFEPMRLNILVSRHGGSSWLDLFISRFIDLKPLATRQVTYPLYFYGLKYICKSLGFKWTGELQSGGESIDWYERWCETGERKILDDIIQYNEDDVRATLFLKDWLVKYAGERTQYEKPYPWEKG